MWVVQSYVFLTLECWAWSASFDRKSVFPSGTPIASESYISSIITILIGCKLYVWSIDAFQWVNILLGHSLTSQLVSCTIICSSYMYSWYLICLEWSNRKWVLLKYTAIALICWWCTTASECELINLKQINLRWSYLTFCSFDRQWVTFTCCEPSLKYLIFSW